MDFGDVAARQNRVRDEIGAHCQKLFQSFLEEYMEDDEVKYLEPAKELVSPERSTLVVSFDDVERYNQVLATTIIEEYYRIYPFLCQAVWNFVKDAGELKKEKECYVSLVDVPTRHKLRELTTSKIGTLIRISGQVVRTHPVHPELVLGTFLCVDCNAVIKNVEQQFKFTNPTICTNPVCLNRRRFVLDVDNSIFVDFQKVRIQETQSELPRGCIPRSLEIILRAETVETVQAGDRYDFTGTLIVVPDVGALALPGTKAEISSRHKAGETGEGVRGLKALGVRDLNYRLAFLACSVTATSLRFGGTEMAMEDISQEMMKRQMTETEWNKVYEMSRDKNLYENLVSSLFPSIHGNDEVKKGITLMLFGGVGKTTMEGTSLRGDINCCIVGDPSTAKSQLLKQVADISPRAVYTSGKASSAAGLTAAVVRDEESGDFVIEAGANSMELPELLDVDRLHDDLTLIHFERTREALSDNGEYPSLHQSAYVSQSAGHLKLAYDDEDYVALNLEDEFDGESIISGHYHREIRRAHGRSTLDERYHRPRRKHKRKKHRSDYLPEVTEVPQVVLIDHDELPLRARWTIVATACLLFAMSLLLVGITLRMAPIIDDMVRKENEELLNSLNRDTSVPENSTVASL